MTDPIADFLTQIRNAQMARQKTVSIPFSKMKAAIAETMRRNKFLGKTEKDESGKFPVLKLELPAKKIELKRVSKPGQRIYKKFDEIYKIKNGFGISVISTSKGVMTGYEARAQKLGGEYLCEIS